MDRDEKRQEHGGVLRHDGNPSVGDQVGEAVGSVSGAVTGAAIGSAGGPIGTIIGGIAGAAGGWWAGRTVAEAASRFTSDDDEYYRSEYENRPERLADRNYEDVRPAYQLGHVAGLNPDYQGKTFDAVEYDLQRGWSNDVRARHGDWSSVRPYAEEAYSRGSSLTDVASVTARESANKSVNSQENLSDPASLPAPDPTEKRF
jgi:hypothetical protein